MGQYGDKEGGCRTHAAGEKERLAPMQALDGRGYKVLWGWRLLQSLESREWLRCRDLDASMGPFRVLKV